MKNYRYAAGILISGLCFSQETKIALQIPVYYNTKTATENGTWKMGAGLSYSFK